MKKGYFTEILSGVVPSQAFIKANEYIFGAVGALGGLATRNPLGVLAGWQAGVTFGAFSSGTMLEGGNHARQ